MKIVALRAKNIKRLTAVEITPDGAAIIIGGQNAAGKSSVLDSIAYALGGKSLIPDEPLKRGESKGHVTVEIAGSEGQLKITRAFTNKGTTSLKVTQADGSTPASPQTLLDSLCDKIAFDPLEFVRMPPEKQGESLRELVGLDFTKHDAKRRSIFEERTGVNRELRAVEAQLNASLLYINVPAEEISAVALSEELQTAQAANRAREDARGKASGEYKRTIHGVEAAERNLKAAKESCKNAEKLTEEAESMIEVDCQPIIDRIAASDTINAKVRSNIARKRLSVDANGLSERVDGLTTAIENFDDAKQKEFSAAKWPIDGLGFNEDGITFSDLPFEQASSAEQLRVAVAIGLEMNPTLRVLLIRDGSLLDDANLSMVADMAAKADAQVWIERVGEGEECAVIIEDGHVK